MVTFLFRSVGHKKERDDEHVKGMFRKNMIYFSQNDKAFGTLFFLINNAFLQTQKSLRKRKTANGSLMFKHVETLCGMGRM